MYDVLKETFLENLDRYGIFITVGNRQIKALFSIRSNTGMASSKGKDQYLTMFTKFNDDVQQGETVTLDGKQYLALRDNSNENNVYNKTYCIDCNQLIKYELRHSNDTTKADLIEFYVNADNITASNVIESGVTLIKSTCHFLFPLNDLTRRINVNERFFSGQSKSGVWRIRDINYQNGFCDLYCIRDVRNNNDDADNMIADRWEFEHKPDTYTVILEPSAFAIEEEKTQQLTVTVRKNSDIISPTPTIIYSVADGSILSVDPATNIVTGLKAGKTTITGSYLAESNDFCVNGQSVGTITAKPVVADIVVSPPYNSDGYYKQKQNYPATSFTASILGVSNPQWTITLDPQGNTASAYTSTIDNAAGTFTVKCNSASSKYLKYTIGEATTGKAADYFVCLASAF